MKNLSRFIVALLLLPMVSAFSISEIMYNPEGDDNNREFVEIFMDIPADLAGSVIADAASNDSLTLLQWKESQYALIVEEGFNYTGINASVYSAGSTIGNNLDNTGDNITLFSSNGTLLADASYTSTLANNNGKSLESVDGAWQESLETGGTPGKPPSQPAMPNSGNATDSAGNTTANATVQNRNCTPLFSISTDKMIYESGEKAQLGFNLTPEDNFAITYWVEDLQQTIVKEPRTTSNTNTKSFTPDVETTDQSLLFFANASVCNTTLRQQALFTVRGNTSLQQEASSIQILDVGTSQQGRASWGESINVQLQAYRGNTRKSVVQVLVANQQNSTKASQVSKMTIDDRNMVVTSTVPVQLKQNCNSELPDGDYRLIAAGLDASAEQQVHIEGTTAGLCPDKNGVQGSAENSAGQQNSDAPLDIEITDVPEAFDPGIQGETVVHISNPGQSQKTATVWSYVYRGSRTYSGEREGNKQEVSLSAGTEADVTLQNTVEGAGPGSYKLKIKVLEQGRKTPQEFTEDVDVLGELRSSSETVQALGKPQQEGQIQEAKPTLTELPPTTLVFESRVAKIRKNIPYALLLLCFVIIVVLVVKDKHVHVSTQVASEAERSRIGEHDGRTFK